MIAGIDDNFFVTEMPVRVDGKKLGGRTLYVSLSLLKELQLAEAEAVLAHELAHFSSDDTFYSMKFAPLLEGHQRYLQALYDSGIGRLVFYSMNCFRALSPVPRGEPGLSIPAGERRGAIDRGKSLPRNHRGRQRPAL